MRSDEQLEYPHGLGSGSLTEAVGALPERTRKASGTTRERTPPTQSDSRFHSLVALATDWYWEQDERFRFTVMTDNRGNEGLPYRPSEFIGKARWELPGEPVYGSWEDHIATLRTHRPFRDFEVTRVDSEGERFTVQISGDPVFDAAGVFKGYRGVARNITQDKRNAVAVKEANERYRALANLSADGLMLLDGNVMIFVNSTLVEMLRAESAEALIGRSILEFIHPDYRADVQARSERLSATDGEDELKERKLLCCDGTTCLVEMRGVSLVMGGRRIVQSVARNITRYRQIETDLRRSEERFRDVAEAAGEYVWEVDAAGRYTYVSARVQEVLGYKPEELLGKSFADILHAEDRVSPSALARFEHTRGERSREIEVQALARDGRLLWLLLSAVPYFDQTGCLAGYRGTGLDITQRKSAEQHIRKLATHDPLTELPNRILLQDRLMQSLIKAERRRATIGVLFIDLDGFKAINDALGHGVGDAVLRQVAQRLRALLHAEDTVCRLGGDEFVIATEFVRDSAELDALARRIVERLAHPYRVGANGLSLRASVGVSLYPADGKSAEELIRHADFAMYQAKKAGGGRYAAFSLDLMRESDEKLRFERELQRVIFQGELTLYLQPIFSIRERALVGAEALLRWPHPERGLLTPAAFIPMAEAANMMAPLGDWVLNHVAQAIAAWYQDGVPQLRIAINVSIQQLAAGAEFVDYLREVLQRHRIPAQLLEIEVTESLLIHSREAIANTLQSLRDLGISIVIDDFGTGYSGLHLLTDLPIDTIKVDRAFFKRLGEKELAVLTAITGLSRALGLQVVAEGVESEDQLSVAAQLGCHRVQGHLFGAPLPLEQFRSRYLAR